VEIDTKQIANRVRVFIAIQPARRNAAWIGLLGKDGNGTQEAQEAHERHKKMMQPSDIPLRSKEGWLRHQENGPVPWRRRRGG
jgi:hypothetical protein